MNNKTGTLYIIPSSLNPEDTRTFSKDFIKTVRSISYFFVENERSTRRFLKALDDTIVIDHLRFMPVNHHEKPDLSVFKKWLQQGNDVGIVSEAGYPCIADPGSILVKTAHELRAKVIPLVGPNAMMMALAASGLKGQQFTFSGYLPVKAPERIKALKALEKKMILTGETQIFMETPYRNNVLIQDIVNHCRAETILCIAADITGPTEFIKTLTVNEWKRSTPDLNKRPAVFLLGK